MKRWVYVHLISCCLNLVILTAVYGQTPGLDTSEQQTALNTANAHYIKAIGTQLPLYNGPEYNYYRPEDIRGSAYFLDTVYSPGSVYYDGARYKGVQLLYDLYKDQLTALLFDQFSKYVLVNNRVQNFDLLGHHFINIDADTLPQKTVITSGYYDELYHGSSQVLSKKYKTVQHYTSTTGAQEAYSYFTPTKEDFFVRHGNTYYNVSGKGGLLGVLKDKRKQLQQYIKSNKIKFNKDEGTALATVAAYYDRITN